MKAIIACLLVLTPLVPTLSANAENLFLNPSFDSNVAYWDVSSYSNWSDSENDPITSDDHGGSLLIATSGKDYAEQCVTLPTDRILEFGLSMYLVDDSETCSEQVIKVEMTFWDGHRCDFELGGARSLYWPFENNIWTRRLDAIEVPPGANSLRLTLSAECRTHRGTTAVYFDDAKLMTDEIFLSQFE